MEVFCHWLNYFCLTFLKLGLLAFLLGIYLNANKISQSAAIWAELPENVVSHRCLLLGRVFCCGRCCHHWVEWPDRTTGCGLVSSASANPMTRELTFFCFLCSYVSLAAQSLSVLSVVVKQINHYTFRNKTINCKEALGPVTYSRTQLCSPYVNFCWHFEIEQHRE